MHAKISPALFFVDTVYTFPIYPESFTTVFATVSRDLANKQHGYTKQTNMTRRPQSIPRRFIPGRNI